MKNNNKWYIFLAAIEAVISGTFAYLVAFQPSFIRPFTRHIEFPQNALASALAAVALLMTIGLALVIANKRNLRWLSLFERVSFGGVVAIILSGYPRGLMTELAGVLMLGLWLLLLWLGIDRFKRPEVQEDSRG